MAARFVVFLLPILLLEGVAAEATTHRLRGDAGPGTQVVNGDAPFTPLQLDNVSSAPSLAPTAHSPPHNAFAHALRFFPHPTTRSLPHSPPHSRSLRQLSRPSLSLPTPRGRALHGGLQPAIQRTRTRSVLRAFTDSPLCARKSPNGGGVSVLIGRTGGQVCDSSDYLLVIGGSYHQEHVTRKAVYGMLQVRRGETQEERSPQSCSKHRTIYTVY